MPLNLRRRFIKPQTNTAGLAAGSLVFVGRQKIEQSTLSYIGFSPGEYYVSQPILPQELPSCYQRSRCTWIDVQGLHDEHVIRQVGDTFGIHPLLLEDVMNTDQRPKIEITDDLIFIVAKMLYASPDSSTDFVLEQVSFVLGPDFLITFQEQPGDVFQPIRQRLENPESRVRQCSPDYLMNALLDSVVDHYLMVMEQQSSRLDQLEEHLLRPPNEETLRHIHHIKRDLLYIRKSLLPLKEVTLKLQKTKSPLMHVDTMPYVNDVADHLAQVVDVVESLRELANSLADMYLSAMSHQMNNIMKVLTIFSALFIPLTFIVGVYGMNFSNMPELHTRYGYPVVWGVMILVTLVMVGYFKHKRWL